MPLQIAVKNKTREIFFAFLSIVFGLIFALVLAEWLLGIYSERLQTDVMDPGLIRYNALLGWSLSPDWSGVHKRYDYEVTYTTNQFGFRHQSEYGASPPEKRIAVFGDSFTFGLGVNDEETFVSRLNQSKSGIYYVNYAIPGTSTDQQLLLINQILENEPADEILLVVYLANDLIDNTLLYPTQAQQGKPHFGLTNDRLQLTNTPVPLTTKPPVLQQTTLGSLVLADSDLALSAPSLLSRYRFTRLLTGFLQEQYDSSTLNTVFEKNLEHSLNLFSAILDNIALALENNDREFSVILMPGRDAITDTGSLSQQYQNFLRNNLNDILTARGIKHLDLMTNLLGMVDNTDPLFFPNDGHLTPEGHAMVAELIASFTTYEN